jgi:DNA-binding response OmpR family regulator/chromosome segregation ATPase
LTSVLIFESDASFASELQQAFEGLGCTVNVTDDANAGIQMAAAEKPDLILLTIELPRMNGFSVCNKIKRDAALKDVPLIIMSSDSTEETFEQHRRLRTRAEEYLRKPISFEDLRARLKPFLDLGDVAAGEDTITLEDEIEFDDVDVIEEVGPQSKTVDAEVEDFADQAFDALIDGGPPAPSVPLPPKASVPPPPPVRSSLPPPPPSARVAAVDDDAAEVIITDASIAPPAPDSGTQGADLEEQSTRELEQSQAQAAQLDAARIELAELHQKLSLAQSQTAELEKTQAELLSAQSRIRELQSAMDAASAGADEGLKQELDSARGRVSELEQQLTAAKSASSELEALRERSSGLEQQLDAAKAVAVELDNARNELSASKTRVGELEAAVATASLSADGALKQELDSARARASEGERVLEAARSRTAELDRDLEQARRSADELLTAKARLTELEANERRVRELELETTQLKNDLEEAKSRAASGKGASARELLDLREKLNKKDKELLSLREDLHHREKELIAVRDSSLELERDKADLSDKLDSARARASEGERVLEAARSRPASELMTSSIAATSLRKSY